jgi:hypothetical protein
MCQFSTQSYLRLTEEYLKRDQTHFLVQEMVDRLSDVPLTANAESNVEFERVVERCVHPRDTTEVLVLTGTVLPNNSSIVVLSAEVTSVYNPSS